MGVVEDTERPLKRAKRLVRESNGFSEESSVSDTVNSSLGDVMARPLTSQGEEETVGSSGMVKRSEFVRLITSALYSLGYSRSGELLEEESRTPLHSSVVNSFLRQVMDGKWEESVTTLHMIGLSDEQIVKSASFLLLEQKFLELLKSEKVDAALNTLRKEIVPLRVNTRRTHKLASCVLSPSKFIEHDVSGQDLNSRSKIVEELQKLLPASVIIPEKRLENLVEKALYIQRDSCVFHNTWDSDLSLYSDHQCGRLQIPSQTVQVLEAHGDEVWYLQFSHNGKYLASSSKDQCAIIWEVNTDGRVSLKHRLLGHQKPVITVSWSPDDRQLLTCGHEEVIRRWDVGTGECVHIYEKNSTGSISCGWFPDGKRVFAGMIDKSICMWELEGQEIECWKGQRTQKISDMAVTDDGKWIISMCKDMTISLFDREAKVERLVDEDDVITSFSLAKDSKYLLVNLINQEIHLWSIEGDPKILKRYKGHKRSRFVIRSCFGGYEDAFIASGSEDSQVYVWHRLSGELLHALPGHSGAVNSVSWNPSDLHMLASASDDRTIRIWGLNRSNPGKHEAATTHQNGVVHHCNGN